MPWLLNMACYVISGTTIISIWLDGKGLQRDVVYLGRPIAHSYMSPNGEGGVRCFSGFSQWIQLCTCIVIRFVWFSAKFGTGIVVSINGTLFEDKMRRFMGECAHFSFNKCLTLTTVQVPNLALTHTKRITVWSPNKLWKSNSIFNLCLTISLGFIFKT